MKVLLLSVDNLYLTPYIALYESFFKKHQIDYEVIYWDKSGNELSKNTQYKRFCFNRTNKVSTLMGYWQFRRFVKKLVREKQFDRIVPLHTVAAFLLSDLLLTKYSGKFIYDIRDYSFEHVAVYRKVQEQLVAKSALNVISSQGYLNFLPKGDYVITHNTPKMSFDAFSHTSTTESDPIRLSYIGLIRFMDQNKKILDFFANDSRFHLNFFGKNAGQLAEYCQKNGIHNVTLVDQFKPEETLKFYQETDIIMNLYGNHTPLLDYALSNKLYFAACLYLPILVCKDTYMEKISTQYGFGFVFPMQQSHEKDQLYSWIKSLNQEELMKGCDAFMASVHAEEDELEQSLEGVFLKNLEE